MQNLIFNGIIKTEDPQEFINSFYQFISSKNSTFTGNVYLDNTEYTDFEEIHD